MLVKNQPRLARTGRILGRRASWKPSAQAVEIAEK